MSGGHGHAGHGDAHGHGAAVADTHHGPAEIPPAPAVRSITPAPEDFQNLPDPSAMLWPLLWIGLAILLVSGLLCAGWHLWAGHHDEGAGRGETHEAPKGH